MFFTSLRLCESIKFAISAGYKSNTLEGGNMSDKKKIIVVDDDQDIVDSITMILESAGYDALTADSSDSCRELLKSVKPDLFILGC